MQDKIQFLAIFPGKTDENLAAEIDNLNPTDDGESCQKAHSPSNSRQFRLHVCLLILGDFVKGGGSKVDPHKAKVGLFLVAWVINRCTYILSYFTSYLLKLEDTLYPQDILFCIFHNP